MRIFPKPRAGLSSAGARLGLLSAYYEGCGGKGSRGCLETWGCVGVGSAASLAAHRHDCTIHLSVSGSGCPRNLSCGTASGYCEGEELPTCICQSVEPCSLVPTVGRQGHSHPCSCHALSLQATDADTGLRGTITFSIVSVVLVEDNGGSRPFENLFGVSTTPDKGAYIGSIR